MEESMEERHAEISDKLFDIAASISNEGDEADDYILQSTGNFIMLISGLMHNEQDVEKFSDLCAMFSAKKILDGHMSNGSGEFNLDKDEMDKMMRDIKKGLNKDDEDLEEE